VVLVLAPFLAVAQERIIESVVPALAYGGACTSTIDLRNLAGRAADITVEGHKPSGAPAGLAGRPTRSLHLRSGERVALRLDIDEETSGAWAKVQSPPSVAVAAKVECTDTDQLRTATREIAFPLRSPWFSAEAAGVRDGAVALINVSDRPARATACYSAGNLYSVPGSNLRPICSASFEWQIPPFGSREFPVVRDGAALALKTSGDAIVLEMLRPVAASVRLFRVDSSIRFGEEVKQ